MDIRKKKFRKDWLAQLDIEESFLPDLCRPDQYIGGVTQEASVESGLDVGTRIYAGIGDAGATTLASGINNAGEININLGTSGWVAAISDTVLEKEGVFSLVSADAENYINVVPFLNAGNVHHWIAETFAGNTAQSSNYEEISNRLKSRRPGSGNLLFLPYIVGERFPIMDPDIKGAYYGINPRTTDTDFISAALEGVAFSIRQGLEEICKNPTKLSLIGGGARERSWSQILADVMGVNITVFSNTEFLPALTISALVFSDCKVWSNRDDLVYRFVSEGQTETYYPNLENKELYDVSFNNFKKLYPRLKGI
jgi:xylulokinase